MAPDNLQQSRTKICPTCGTRMNESATRCLVCGHIFTGTEENKPSPKKSKTSRNDPLQKKPRLPEVRLSLPIAIGLIILAIVIGAAVVFLSLQNMGRVVEPTPLPTNTGTPTITFTPTTTYTPTLVMTATPLPPVEYTVKEGDLCSSIAALFNISISSIVLENNLTSDCYLSPGMVLKLPQPTPTVTPLPTNTLTGSEATLAACGSYDYIVGNTDTLFGIALNFGVSTDIIRQYNGLMNDIVVAGSTLHIPLCERITPGPTSTPTNPPPYEAPNLLLPADGSSFNTSGETITLQWAGVGTLLDNEAYEVNIEDITGNTGRKLVDYVKDTKYIVPMSFRPSDPSPHVIKWYVQPVRQSGSQADGTPIYTSAGARSEARTFIWSGVAVQ
ncbi:MAG TPA: LysM peptidoglycan-binding domain-containing protein [Flexilinea sp.]|nr:LysM peptidoglycan-binding domain-containing protein [Flexilinea sp.]